ncbi:DUF5906 domain-containing protein [Candidatus Methanocrinis natronophilus]|uniref:DUF5906 domain-containing protein n=1 Tax=Candidatus Methanocrinis natronophilus TaxID=3033396 RepID=UPI002934C01D|nr:DUF5906 domain-containing protein [Candidatus Methanocrinis natronophilus]
MRLRSPDDFDDTISRARTLYITADVFDPEVFETSVPWEEGPGGEGKSVEPIGERGDLIAYTLFADIDATKDEADEGDKEGKPRSKIYHEGRIEALEAAATFMVVYLRDRGISEAVGVLFSGQGIYVWLHPGLSDMSEVRALPDFDRARLDSDFKIWLMAFNDLLADIEVEFFSEHPEHAGRVKFDKLNNQKRKIKCLLSIHRDLPFAVVPLDKDDIRIDLDAARVPDLPTETVARAMVWLDSWRTGKGERTALARILESYKTKAEEGVTTKAKTTGEIRRATEPVPVEAWCPFYRALLEFPGGAGAHRVCGALATWLYQSGYSEEAAFEIWYPIAMKCNVETRIFYTSYGVINSPNCETIKKTSAGYPMLGFGGMELCVPDERCKECRWPGDYTDKRSRTIEDIKLGADKLVEEFNADPVAGSKNESILCDLLDLRDNEPVLYDQVVGKVNVKKSTINKIIKDFAEKEQQKAQDQKRQNDGVDAVSVQQAIEAVASWCDGAKSIDCIGFNRNDVEFFLPIIDMIKAGEEIPVDRLLQAYGRLKKYNKQLAKQGIDYDTDVIIPGDRGADFTIEDFCYDKDGKGDYKFSRSKAADTLMSKLDLAMVNGGKDIYWFDGEIYRPTGIAKMSQAMYRTAGDFANRRDVGEVIDRIRSEKQLTPVIFNPNPYVMPLQNGVLDLETGEFREFQADDYFSFKYGANWDCEDADWMKFIWFLCTSLSDPRDVLTAIDVMTAVALRIPFDVIVQLIGGGANGKGTFERVLLALFTAERSTAIELPELKSSRFGPGALLDVDLWIISEVEGVKDSISALKKIATGELLDADVKYGGRTRGKPHAIPILDSNNAIDYGDDSYGRKRRTCRLDFCYTFGDGPGMRPIDRRLEASLIQASSLSGLVAIIAARAPHLIKSRKIYTRKSLEEAEEEHKRQRYSLSYFLDECISTVMPKGYKGPKKLTTSDAYNSYVEYCKRFNVPTPATQGQLGEEISKKYGIGSSVTTVDGKSARVYNGLYLVKTPSEAYADHITQFSDYSNYSETTAKLQDGVREIAIDNYITTPTTSDTLLRVIEEIFRIYCFIEACEKEDHITYESYRDFDVVDVVAVVSGRRISVCETTAGKSSVAKPGSGVVCVEEGSETEDMGDLSDETPEPDDRQSIADELRDGHRRQADYLEKYRTPEPKPSGEAGEIFGLPISYFEELAIQTNGLTTKILMQAKKWDDLKSGVALNSLQSMGWAKDDKGRLHPPR